MNRSRRAVLVAGFSGGAAGAFISTQRSLSAADKAKEKPGEKGDAEVSATEDLMREHGVLDRVLLIYQEGLRRSRTKQAVSADVFRQAADLVSLKGRRGVGFQPAISRSSTAG